MTFHSYVSLPEGMGQDLLWILWQLPGSPHVTTMTHEFPTFDDCRGQASGASGWPEAAKRFHDLQYQWYQAHNESLSLVVFDNDHTVSHHPCFINKFDHPNRDKKRAQHLWGPSEWMNIMNIQQEIRNFGVKTMSYSRYQGVDPYM